MKNVPAELMRLESTKKRVEIAKDVYKELHDKIADLQLANQCLSKRLEGMSRAMKGVLDFLGKGYFKCEERIQDSLVPYEFIKSLDSSIRNEFINNVYRGE